MPTSGRPSAVPPNHAAAREPDVSTIVEAWHCRNGAWWKINSLFKRPGCGSPPAAPRRDEKCGEEGQHQDLDPEMDIHR